MNRLEIIGVGKGGSDDVQGNVALTAYFANLPAVAAYNMGEISEENKKKMKPEDIAAEEGKKHFNPKEISLSTTLIYRSCEVVNTMLDKGFVGNINIHSLLQGVVLKFRELSKYKRQARETGEPLDIAKCFQPWMKDIDRDAIIYMNKTIDRALAQGCYIHFVDVGLASYIELNVPAGLNVANGTVVDFKDNKAMVADANGVKREITLRSPWPEGFQRNGAVIIKMARGSEKYPIYVLKRTLNEEKGLSKLEDTVAENWKKCPTPKKATTTQKGSLEEMAAALAA